MSEVTHKRDLHMPLRDQSTQKETHKRDLYVINPRDRRRVGSRSTANMTKETYIHHTQTLYTKTDPQKRPVHTKTDP